LGNLVKEKIKQGIPAIGHWLSLPCSAVAELLADIGMDWLLIDTEHSPTDYETLEDIIRAMKGTDVVPLVRVAGNDPVLIKKALDRGAYGVIVPLVNTAEAAARAVAAAKYPPEGMRGVAGTRVSGWGKNLREYFTKWNQDGLVILQIETAQALENVEKIAAVPGVDVLFIGPADLSANLGVFQQFDHPKFIKAVDRIKAAAAENGIATGFMASGAESVLAKVDEGFKFIAVGTDARLLAAAAQTTYKAISEGLTKREEGNLIA
jgi:2-keto-3-deoxy-L-rhamnonate aldolase RhmA